MKPRCILVVTAIFLTTLSLACTGQDSKSAFAIYLPAEEMTIDELAVISHIDIDPQPLISIDDIISYSQQTHELKLKPSAAQRLWQLDLVGKPFVVCVDRAPVYAGAFMALYFSRSYDGVVILWPLFEEDADTIRLQLGYPESPELFTGEDPRSDPHIMKSIDDAGKLK